MLGSALLTFIHRPLERTKNLLLQALALHVPPPLFDIAGAVGSSFLISIRKPTGNNAMTAFLPGRSWVGRPC